jgi:hypothetical protein
MPFRYCNLTSGQVIESDEILSHLEGLARWDRTEQAATPAAVAPSVPAPKPARAPRVKAAKPDTGE